MEGFGSSRDIIYTFIHWSSNLLSMNLFQSEMWRIWKDRCTKISTVEMFIRVKVWKQPKCHCWGAAWPNWKCNVETKRGKPCHGVQHRCWQGNQNLYIPTAQSPGYNANKEARWRKCRVSFIEEGGEHTFIHVCICLCSRNERNNQTNQTKRNQTYGGGKGAFRLIFWTYFVYLTLEPRNYVP